MFLAELKYESLRSGNITKHDKVRLQYVLFPM